MEDSDFKILVVDDDAVLADVIKRALEGMGFETHVAADGIQALELLKTLKVSLILSDIQMPRMDGLAFLKAVNTLGLGIPIVMMTGYSDYSEEDVGQQTGAGLLRKPFHRARLMELVKAYARALPKSG